MMRTSLTLGLQTVHPKVTHVRSLTTTNEVLLAGAVEIIEGFSVQSRSVEALLEISTAFADAAHGLIRLEDQQALEAHTAQAQAVTA